MLNCTNFSLSICEGELNELESTHSVLEILLALFRERKINITNNAWDSIINFDGKITDK